MIIESKKTGLTQEISIETWDKLGENQKQQNFKIIDKAPLKMGRSKIEVPKEIQEIKEEIKTKIKIPKKKTKKKKNGNTETIRGVSKDNVKS